MLLKEHADNDRDDDVTVGIMKLIVLKVGIYYRYVRKLWLYASHDLCITNLQFHREGV